MYMKKQQKKVYIVNQQILPSTYVDVESHYQVNDKWFHSFDDVLEFYPLSHYDLFVSTLPESLIVPKLLLTPHFSLRELISSRTYYALTKSYIVNGFQNYIPNIVRLAQCLEIIRCAFGDYITINSGFRNKTLNDSVHGSSKSYHLIGSAADICPTYIRDAFTFDHLLTAVKNSHPREFYANDARTFIHVAF